MRLPLIAGNWKMHKTVGESRDFVENLRGEVAGVKNAEIIVCPPYTALYEVARRLMGSNIGLGAQDVFWKEQGAYTGQISPRMLLDVGCTHTIIGHSETRGRFGKAEEGTTPALMAHFADSDETVNAKLHAALAAGLTPIVCVGETIDERKAGRTDDVIRTQVEKGLAGLNAEQAAGMVIAYEPVWAIGTGEVCDVPEANRVCGMIRSIIRSVFGDEAADGIRIQYGGSVKPDNAEELLRQPEIDGALVGGASLKVPDFVAIIRSV
ncbi:MAG TPA: triose-phosphate isomerase [Armatimonadota bacterium]|nr:triose-phosphate isomerase [Armatimonadota bacterium]